MSLSFHTQSSLPTDRPWRVKVGFDPTAPDLHLGHAVLLRAARALQDQGHEVVLVVGDFTATIGDPSGRNSTRPMLSANEVAQNAQSYLEQALLILDPARTVVRHNSEWLTALGSAGLLGLLQQFTLAQMTARHDIADRVAQHEAVGLHELVYPLLQGYDSVVVRADLELGGNDQLFNLHAGRTMQELHGQPPQSIASVPLLLGTDGVRKMSKSFGNHIALRDPPTEVFGKTMRIPDGLVSPWAALLQIPLSDQEPYAAKRALAHSLVQMLHGPQAASVASADWDERFSKRAIPDAAARVVAPGSTLTQILVDWGFVPSAREARQKIREGGVRVDGEKVLDPHHVPTEGVIQLGRRHSARIQADCPTAPTRGIMTRPPSF